MHEDLDDLAHDQDDDRKDDARFYDGICPTPRPCSFDPSNDRCRVCDKKQDVSAQTRLLMDLASARAAGLPLAQDDLSADQWEVLGMLCSRNQQQQLASTLSTVLMTFGFGPRRSDAS